jgi:hypothetical protein
MTYPPDPDPKLIKARAEAEEDLKRQKQSAREAGPCNGRVTVFVGRTSHCFPQCTSSGEVIRLLRGSGRLLIDGKKAEGAIDLVGGESLELAP